MSGVREQSLRQREKDFRRFAERAYFRVLMTGKMAWDELSLGKPVPLARRAGHLSRGFSTRSALIYGLDRGNAGRFLPDTAWPRMMNLNGRFGRILDNKLLFHQVLHAHAQRIPVNHALILGGRLHPLGDSGGAPERDALRFLRERLPLVLKPVAGSASKGVSFLALQAGGFLLNGAPVSPGGLERLLAGLDDYLVCEHVRQHPLLAGIYPHATATVKVLTVRDVESGEPFVPHACVRIGTDASRPFDALTPGGVTARVGVEDGRLGKARGLFTPEALGRDTHPDTGARIEGLALPHLDLVRSTLLEICRAAPYLNHLVWDLVLTEDGFKILEGNNHPDLALIQMHFPLLEDPRMRSFYTRHGVIGR